MFREQKVALSWSNAIWSQLPFLNEFKHDLTFLLVFLEFQLVGKHKFLNTKLGATIQIFRLIKFHFQCKYEFPDCCQLCVSIIYH